MPCSTNEPASLGEAHRSWGAAYHSLDHLVGTGENGEWDLEAESPGSLQVDGQQELGRLQHRQIRRLLPVVVEFTVKDPDAFRDYGQRAPETVAQHGGRFMVRGGKVEGLKGDPPKGPFVVLAFESTEQAK